MVSGPRVAVLLASALTLACGHELRPADPHVATAASVAELPVATASHRRDDSPLGDAARLRALEPLAPVAVARLGDAEFEARLAQQLRHSTPAEVILGQQYLLQRLGAFDASADLFHEVFTLARTHVVGFYSPQLHDLCVRATLPPATYADVLLHEAVHALQDQHFQLDAALSLQPGSGDRVAVLQAMAEGDAMLTTSLGSAGQGGPHADRHVDPGPDPASTDSVAASLLVRAAAAPYSDGFAFIAGLYARGGWDAVNGAWQQPPQSTEQLLHPAKFSSREPFVDFAPSPSPPERGSAAATCSAIHWDVLGEQGTRLLFEEWAPRSEAGEAARGWNGDRVDVFGCGQISAVAWRLAFDTARDLAQARALLERRFVPCDETLPVAVAHTPAALIVTAANTTCTQVEAWARDLATSLQL